MYHDPAESGMRMMAKAVPAVPAFAAGLGVTLQPIKADEAKPEPIPKQVR